MKETARKKRHICCKCGRKRKEEFLFQNNSLSRLKLSFCLKWAFYPRVDSWKCAKPCIPFAEKVLVTSER